MQEFRVSSLRMEPAHTGSERLLERFAGFEYKACCWRLRAVARRAISNREGTQETSFYVQMELTGLSSVGNADAFLEHAIRGYSPETTVR